MYIIVCPKWIKFLNLLPYLIENKVFGKLLTVYQVSEVVLIYSRKDRTFIPVAEIEQPPS